MCRVMKRSPAALKILRRHRVPAAAARSAGWALTSVGIALAVAACDDFDPFGRSARPMSRGLEQQGIGRATGAGAVLGIVARRAPIRAEPSQQAKILGYATAGAVLEREGSPRSNAACPGGWYAVSPRGYVCSNEQTTLDEQHPTLKARELGPNRLGPLPYPYASTQRASTSYEPDPRHQDGVRERGRIAKGATFAVVGSWTTLDEYDQRQQLAMLTLGVFVPSRDIKLLKLDEAPGFEVNANTPAWPIGIPLTNKIDTFQFVADRLVPASPLETLQPQALSVRSRTIEDRRYFQLSNGSYVSDRDLAMVRPRLEFPNFVSASTRWLDLEVTHGIVVLYEGTQPRYVTRTLALPATDLQRGTTRVRAKHISDLSSSTLGNESGSNHVDAPWVIELENGIAIRAALSQSPVESSTPAATLQLHPKDAAALFRFLQPDVPEGWHAIYTDARSTAASQVVIR